jgi:hypothetical protein
LDSVPPVVTRASSAPISWARARVTSASSSEAAGAWSQESMDGLRAEAARSAAVATARGGQCRWAAHRGVGGVGRALGESPYEDV